MVENQIKEKFPEEEEDKPSVLPVVQFREKSIKKCRSIDHLDLINNDTERKISSLDELSPGDHIVISPESKEYSHALVVSLNVEKSIIEAIYFYDPEVQWFVQDLILFEENSQEDFYKCGVKKNTFVLDLGLVSVFIVNYEERIIEVEQTLKKAGKFVGQVKYNMFINNDEHFAIYCKTGKAAKLFVINPKDLTAKKIIGKNLSQKAVENLAQQSGQIVLVNTAKHIATKFPRNAVAAGIPAAAEAAGTLLGVGIEGISMGYDIYQKHKEFKEGKLNEIKFKKYIARRVTRGTMSVAGGVAGGILGQMIIPIPVVGAVLGSLVGGIVGAVAGQGEGILIGELVEIIDNKIKDVKKKQIESKPNVLAIDNSLHNLNDGNEKPKAEEKINQEEKLVTNKYEVIDKLVFKFDKDLLKPANFAHLEDVKIEEINGSNTNLNSLPRDGSTVITNPSELINDDDYEIYVLNETNEVVSHLNVQDSLDSNGAILKRTSIELFSADQLPNDLNVFFKINDAD